MKICKVNVYSFQGNNKKPDKKTYLSYPVMQGIGAAAGYLIPLNDIDGQDITVASRGGLAMKQKTKVPNIVGKWKNALIGAFIGTAFAAVYDFIKTEKQK